MIRALYSAASGMRAEETNVDNIANNLANANTVGYKMRRAQFQDLPEQYEHRDHRGRFVVDGYHLILPQVFGKEPRREGGGEAVQKGGTDTESDQAEHIERAVAHRGPAADEKRPAGP